MSQEFPDSLDTFLFDDQDDWAEKNPLSKRDDSRYTDVILIASGGQKNIYSAHDTKLDREVALAELQEDIPEREAESFINEIFLTASFQHPNIIKILDFGIRKEDTPYFTMELMQNSTLNDYIKKQQQNSPKNLEIFLKICDAISYAHSKGVIHLDLKPANIQVGSHGEVLISDWGLSKKIEPNLKCKSKRGTPGFMAPEQVSIGALLGPATDIYSLGTLLKFLYSKTPEDKIPQSISAVIKKAMAQEANLRYSKVQELQNEISNFMGGFATAAEDAGFLKELKLLFRRNLQLCWTIIIAFFLITGISSYLLMNLKDKNISLAEAVLKLEKTGRELQDSVHKEKRLNTELKERELSIAKNLMLYPVFFSSPAQSSQQALEIYKRQKSAKYFHKEIFMIYMIRQDFESILKEEIKAPYELIRIAQQFNKMPKRPDGLLKDRMDFINLLHSVNKLPDNFVEFKQQFMERAVCYRNDVEKPITMSHNVVKQIIKTWNPNWDLNKIDYNLEKMTLLLRGEKLTRLNNEDPWSSRLCFLRFLKINHLDLKHTGINSLSNIRGMEVESVDVRFTPVYDLHPHESTRDINVAIIRPGQFNEDALSHLPPAVKIIEKK
ncbi:probable threonine/tyrosine-specific protein kinase [Lentisphaera araneosa HTCC2155]|uniref:Probable threonine/tyrosine-specific protein kinase n=1 Tax=Lentisphaera araneosa HTCC2155 TaxID=313628 RepID=A6DIH2_9BACT|nr:serine/threonine-protein kinase [Lentisphaera araneosa]EDM28826.1 probable threonine/tyrosine-specific protein kinase [Lentisphaera araneosa HTCC2155]